MSHNCDYKELVGAVDEANYWSSELTPGRRRRRNAVPDKKLDHFKNVAAHLEKMANPLVVADHQADVATH